jgi:hypothetical protein
MSLNCGHQRAYCLSPGHVRVCRATADDVDRGKPKNLEINLSSATLSTINSTWTGPGANPGLRNERPSTNRLSHGTAECVRLLGRVWA